MKKDMMIVIWMYSLIAMIFPLPEKFSLDFISILVCHFAHGVKPLRWFLAYVHCSTINRVLALFNFGCGRRSEL